MATLVTSQSPRWLKQLIALTIGIQLVMVWVHDGYGSSSSPMAMGVKNTMSIVIMVETWVFQMAVVTVGFKRADLLILVNVYSKISHLRCRLYQQYW